MKKLPLLAVAAVALAVSAPVLAYNSLAPHTNTENTDFWDTRGYNVTPASSASGLCATDLNRCVCTESESNAIQSFRRMHVIGMVIELR